MVRPSHFLGMSIQLSGCELTGSLNKQLSSVSGSFVLWAWCRDPNSLSVYTTSAQWAGVGVKKRFPGLCNPDLYQRNHRTSQCQSCSGKGLHHCLNMDDGRWMICHHFLALCQREASASCKRATSGDIGSNLQSFWLQLTSQAWHCRTHVTSSFAPSLDNLNIYNARLILQHMDEVCEQN